ncbi:MFS transporter [Lentilitoribacter sp. EG35]|uniref:MFS transporter n=1 Tax=Lentilitoribacter sp. EG35 TaxID=3234192 RepID=UPI003460B1E1
MLTTISICWNDKLWRLSFCCILFMGVVVASLMPYLSIIGIERLGFSDTTYAIVTTGGALMSLLASVFVGVYTDQTGRYREVLITSIALGIIGSLAMYLMPAKGTFILAHVLMIPLASTAFTQYFALGQLAANRNPKIDRDFSSSAIRAGFSLSFALTPPVWAFFIAQGMDLFIIYAVMAVLNIFILTLVFTSWPKDQTSDNNEKSGITFFQGLRELTALPVMIRVFAISAILGAVNLYNIVLGLIIINNLDGIEAQAGLFAGGVALIEVPVMLISPAILRYVSKSAFIGVGALIYIIYLIPFGTMSSMTSAWWLMLPAGIGAGILLSVSVGYMQDMMTHRPGAGGALVSVSHFSAAIFASGVFAFGTSVSDYVGTSWIGAGCAIFGAILLMGFDKWRLRSKAYLLKQGIEV